MQIDTLDKLHALYGTPKAPSLVKVADRITPEYRAWIEAAPFAVLATVGPEGVDVSPRGDRGPVLAITDERTLALPDRRGNDRLDSLRNIVRDPRVSLMLMVPGENTVIRVIGTARISADPALLEAHAVDGIPPRSVVLITVVEVYFQCARALVRSALWSGAHPPRNLPSPGDILAAQTNGAVGGPDYDRAWPERAAKTLW